MNLRRYNDTDWAQSTKKKVPRAKHTMNFVGAYFEHISYTRKTMATGEFEKIAW